MNTNLIQQYGARHMTRALFVATALLSGAQAQPVFAAAYTFAGRSFDTYAEMTAYAQEYMAVWRSIHGQEVTPSSANEPTTSDTITSADVPVAQATVDGAVRTSLVQDLAYDRARLTGTVTSGRTTLGAVWFEYGTNPFTLASSTPKILRTFGRIETPFDRKVHGLTSETTYYVRAVGSTASGRRVVGDIKSFRTPVNTDASNALVHISSTWVTALRDDSATVSTYLNMGKSDTAYAWVEYGDEGDDLYKRTAWKLVQKSSLFGYEAVMLPLRNLKPETQYSYRVVVQDMNGAVAYGHLGTFRTNRDIINEKPTFTQVSAKNVRVHTVEFKAFVDMNDFDDGAVFLLYGKENAEITAVPASYTTYDRIHERGDALQKVLLDDSLSTNGLYSVTIDDLDRNTNYYYAFGTAYEGVDRKDVITLGSLGGVRTQQ